MKAGTKNWRTRLSVEILHARDARWLFHGRRGNPLRKQTAISNLTLSRSISSAKNGNQFILWVSTWRYKYGAWTTPVSVEIPLEKAKQVAHRRVNLYHHLDYFHLSVYFQYPQSLEVIFQWLYFKLGLYTHRKDNQWGRACLFLRSHWLLKSPLRRIQTFLL